MLSTTEHLERRAFQDCGWGPGGRGVDPRRLQHELLRRLGLRVLHRHRGNRVRSLPVRLPNAGVKSSRGPHRGDVHLHVVELRRHARGHAPKTRKIWATFRWGRRSTRQLPPGCRSTSSMPSPSPPSSPRSRTRVSGGRRRRAAACASTRLRRETSSAPCRCADTRTKLHRRVVKAAHHVPQLQGVDDRARSTV